MAADYIADKVQKKKSGLRLLWLLLLFIVIVLCVVIKVVSTGNLKPDAFNNLPTSDEAYAVAKEFVKPTIKSENIDFNDLRYQFAKTSDSVYVIKSSLESQDMTNEKVTTNFKIVLKYNGGQPIKAKNWTLVSLDKF
jgi:hypothetical protein